MSTRRQSRDTTVTLAEPAQPTAEATAPALSPDKSGAANDSPMTIGELARELSLTTRTIRFYEAKGLITPQRRGIARCYGRRDVVRMQIILRGKNLGFSLEEIARYLELYDADPAQITQTEMLLAGVNNHIELLQKQRADLDRTLRELRDIRVMCETHLKAADKR